jgi:hypothetical protein
MQFDDGLNFSLKFRRLFFMKWEGQYYSAQICYSEKDVDSLYHFNENVTGGFSFFRSQMPAPNVWPMAVLLDVEVPRPLRRKRAGTKAVQKFVDEAKAKGAILGFLRVGWTGEDSERGWRIHWYQRLGWNLLQNPSEHLIIPFMYQILG